MEFIEKYARVEAGEEEDDNDEMAEADQVRHLLDDEFIDDENSFQDQCPLDYRLVNLTRDMTEACNDLEYWKDFECSDPGNYVHKTYGSRTDHEPEYDEIKGFEKRIEQFNSSLKQFRGNDNESFYFAILYGTYFKLKGKDDDFSDDLQAFLGTMFLEQLEEKRSEMFLDLNIQTLERQCHMINDVLLSKNLFLRVFEKRKQFRYVIKKLRTKNEVKRELSSCIKERFNGFQVVRHLFGKEEKRKFEPLDIVYKPIKSLEQKIECYFTDEIRLAYRAVVHRGKLMFDSMTAEQCYACNFFVAGIFALDKHLETCSFIPGIVYKFENQHITTFEDNFRFMGEQPFAIYFDLETTCGKKEFYNVEKSDNGMYPVYYCFIVAFHPSLDLDKITVLRSFNDSFEQLNDISYLPNEMIRYFDHITVKQLQACTKDVLRKKRTIFP